MADNSINIFPKKGESSEEFESFEIVGIVENIEKKKKSYTLHCKGHGDDERSFQVIIKNPELNFGFSLPEIKNPLNLKLTDLYIDWNTEIELSKENFILTTEEMWVLLSEGSIEKDKKTINKDVVKAYFSQVGKGKKLRKRRQSHKNNKSSRKQRRSRKNNKSSRKVLKSRRRASRQKGGSVNSAISQNYLA